jgi:hypothetical protein
MPARMLPLTVTVMPLSEARHAHELNETGHAQGKIVLKVDRSTSFLETGLVIKLGQNWGFGSPPDLPAAPPWMSGVEIIHS